MSEKILGISRVIRSKQDAEKSYDTMSRWYDLLTGKAEKRYRDACVQMLQVTEGMKVLEIGFGTGESVLLLARLVGDTGKVYGVDISEGMNKIASSKLHMAGLDECVELLCADAVCLPFQASFFDAVVMSFTLELFDTPEIPMVLAECRRVLRSGGRLGVVSLSKKPGVMVQLYEWVHKLFPRMVDCRPIYLQKSLEDAGFHIVEAREMSMYKLPVEVVIAYNKK